MDIKLWHYVLATVLIGFMDGCWINFYMKKVFITNVKESSLGYWGNPAPKWLVGIAVWPILGFGLVFFALSRLSPDDSIGIVILTGIAYGFVVHGFYVITNNAIIDHYTVKVALHDGGWGTTMSAIVTVIIWALAK